MTKKSLGIATILFLVFELALPLPPAEARSILPDKIFASSLCVYDPALGKILYSRTPHARRPLASTTKVMTALVVVEKLKLDEVITVRVETAYVPRTKLYVRPGERFRVRDLLKALLISSSNDVAVVLAHRVAGSERAFARLMNRKARQIGARNTHFVNPHGLHTDLQYSTSYDLALIMKEVRKYPFIMSTLAVKRTQIRSLQGRKFFLKNHNKMLWRDRRPIIGKTGFTRNARYCFVGRMNFRGRDVLVSILGSLRPWHDLRVLLDYYSAVTLKRQPTEIDRNKASWTRRRLQIFERALRRAGFNPGPIDGIVTHQTIRAIRAFQKSRRLPTTGFIGPLTQKQLKRLS